MASEFFVESRELIDGEACPREVVNGPLRVTDSRTETDLGMRGAD